MKATLESTSKIVELKPTPGRYTVPARLWEGTTASGIRFVAYVTRVMVSSNADNSQFEKELEEVAPPSLDVQKIPSRLVL